MVGRAKRLRMVMRGIVMAFVLSGATGWPASAGATDPADHVVDRVAVDQMGVDRVDVNQASVAELTALPGIGPAKAAAIVQERQRRPFSSIDDLTRVSGIGTRTLEQLRDRISVGNAEGGSTVTDR